jgi:hypothetical protein
VTSRAPTVLGAPPAGAHLCQISCDLRALADSVALFAAGGLQRGDLVILVAPPDRVQLAFAGLARRGLDPEQSCASGQLRVFDPHATLAQCLRNGVPDLEQLKRAGDALLLHEPSSERSGRISAYGEMVSLLWQAGYVGTAIRLEEHWNACAQSRPIVFFCAYTLDALAPTSYWFDLAEIGRTHTEVLSTDEDERLATAVEAAVEEVLGIPRAQLRARTAVAPSAGERRLPAGRRTLLWLHRHVPAASSEVLQRVGRHLRGA